jgi:hypothetical protein
LFVSVLAVTACVVVAILAVPEPYTLPAAFSIFGAFMAVEIVRTLREVREGLAEQMDESPPVASTPSTRAELFGLVLAGLWLIPVMAALVIMNLLLLGLDHTTLGFWLAVAAVVAAFEVFVWAFVLRSFRRKGKSA